MFVGSLEGFKNHAFMGGMLIDEDQTLFGFTYDVGVVELPNDPEGSKRLFLPQAWLGIMGSAVGLWHGFGRGFADLATRRESRVMLRSVNTFGRRQLSPARAA